jgi:F0F1-type ATP synthase alpha subunit
MLSKLRQTGRQTGKVERTIEAILKQRVYGLACGYLAAAVMVLQHALRSLVLSADDRLG